jgi:hypothetical protein
MTQIRRRPTPVLALYGLFGLTCGPFITGIYPPLIDEVTDAIRSAYRALVPNANSRQQATMMRIRKVAEALSRYRAAHNGLLPSPPVASGTWNGPTRDAIAYHRDYQIPPLPRAPWPVAEARRVANLPTDVFSGGLQALPTTDAWGHPLYFDISVDRRSFVVVSLGADARPDTERIHYWPAQEEWHDIFSVDGIPFSYADIFSH